MSRKMLFAQVKTTFLTAVAVIAMTLSATASTTRAATTDFASGTENEQDSQPVTWPSFTDELDENLAPPALVHFDAIPGVLSATTTVSAPLPPAALTGLFLLAGNCVVTHLWKKRKI